MSENKNETGSQTSSLGLLQRDLEVKHQWMERGPLWFLYDKEHKWKAVVGHYASKGPLSEKFTIFYFRKHSGLQTGPSDIFDDLEGAQKKAEELSL